MDTDEIRSWLLTVAAQATHEDDRRMAGAALAGLDRRGAAIERVRALCARELAVEDTAGYVRAVDVLHALAGEPGATDLSSS
jgi:hypothetical protein